MFTADRGPLRGAVDRLAEQINQLGRRLQPCETLRRIRRGQRISTVENEGLKRGDARPPCLEQQNIPYTRLLEEETPNLEKVERVKCCNGCYSIFQGFPLSRVEETNDLFKEQTQFPYNSHSSRKHSQSKWNEAEGRQKGSQHWDFTYKASLRGGEKIRSKQDKIIQNTTGAYRQRASHVQGFEEKESYHQYNNFAYDWIDDENTDERKNTISHKGHRKRRTNVLQDTKLKRGEDPEVFCNHFLQLYRAIYHCPDMSHDEKAFLYLMGAQCNITDQETRVKLCNAASFQEFVTILKARVPSQKQAWADEEGTSKHCSSRIWSITNNSSDSAVKKKVRNIQPCKTPKKNLEKPGENIQMGPSFYEKVLKKLGWKETKPTEKNEKRNVKSKENILSDPLRDVFLKETDQKQNEMPKAFEEHEWTSHSARNPLNQSTWL